MANAFTPSSVGVGAVWQMILDPEEEEEEARVKEQDLAYTKLYQRKKEELRISEEHKKEINTISENEPYPVHIGKDGTKWWILSNTRKIPIRRVFPCNRAYCALFRRTTSGSKSQMYWRQSLR